MLLRQLLNFVSVKLFIHFNTKVFLFPFMVKVDKEFVFIRLVMTANAGGWGGGLRWPKSS